MSLNRLNHDLCTYKTNLNQSVSVGNYYTGQPRQDCQSCFPDDPSIQMGSVHIGPIDHAIQGATCKDVSTVDVSNELLGITRPASNCPKDKYQKGQSILDKAYNGTCKLKDPKTCRGIRAEDTRLSNPPCTLRGTGWNRWEWLCIDPQESVTVPFDYNISYRIVAKDNHRPKLPTPINQAPLLPPLNASNEMYKSPWMTMASRPGVDMHIPSVHWRHCDSFGYN